MCDNSQCVQTIDITLIFSSDVELPQLPSLPLSVCPSGLAEDFLQDYIQVNIGSLDLCANHNITQIVEICEDYEKDYK